MLRPRGAISACRYQLFLDDGTHRFLAAARRRKSNAASAYDITTSQSGARDAPGYAGKLRASFLGTEFVLVDGGAKPRADGGGPTGAAAGVAAAAAGLPLRRELAAMSYETNILGTRGPRKMLVAVPAVRASMGLGMAGQCLPRATGPWA
jgi:tubby-related protein 1